MDNWRKMKKKSAHGKKHTIEDNFFGKFLWVEKNKKTGDVFPETKNNCRIFFLVSLLSLAVIYVSFLWGRKKNSIALQWLRGHNGENTRCVFTGREGQKTWVNKRFRLGMGQGWKDAAAKKEAFVDSDSEKCSSSRGGGEKKKHCCLLVCSKICSTWNGSLYYGTGCPDEIDHLFHPPLDLSSLSTGCPDESDHLSHPPLVTLPSSQGVPTKVTTFPTHPLISLPSAQGVRTKVTTFSTHPLISLPSAQGVPTQKWLPDHVQKKKASSLSLFTCSSVASHPLADMWPANVGTTTWREEGKLASGGGGGGWGGITYYYLRRTFEMSHRRISSAHRLELFIITFLTIWQLFCGTARRDI